MCRLFTYVGDLESKKLQIALNEFIKLAKSGCVPCGLEAGHLDGWGIHVRGKNSEIYIRSVDFIEGEILPQLEAALKGKGQVMMHLRKASVGDIRIANTHPFLRAGIAFCHNGSIKAFPDSPLLHDRAFREGHTDSETFFLRVLDRIEGQIGDATLSLIQKAVKCEIEELQSTSNWSSLTCLISSAEGTLVNYLWNENHPKSEEFKFPDYYTMYIGKNNTTTIACSEKLPVEGFVWEKVSNDSLITLSI